MKNLKQHIQNEGVMSRHGAAASDATRAKILKPYDKKTAKATKLKVKNMVSDLDHIAWQFENQFDAGAGNRGKHLLIQAKVTKSIDKIIKQLKSFDGIL